MTELIKFLLETDGKPDNMTWDIIGLQFGLSGDAARKQWKRYNKKDKKEAVAFSSHDPISTDSTLSVSDNGNWIAVKKWQVANGDFRYSYEIAGKEEVETFIETFEDKLQKIIDGQKNNRHIAVLPETREVLVLCLSDMHVGSEISDVNIYGKDVEYNEEVLQKRLDKILQIVISEKEKRGKFRKLILFDLGDSLDGYNGGTTRGGHHLPQNMTNQEQYDVYVKLMLDFWKHLSRHEIALDFEFYGASNNNHSGMGFDYMAMKTVGALVEKMYDVKYMISKKAIDRITVDTETINRTYVFMHGKDEKNRKFGFPLHIDPKTKDYFNKYINKSGLKGNITVLKGDLHQAAVDVVDEFDYINVPSLMGSSEWIIDNFGYSSPGAYYEILTGDQKTSSFINLENVTPNPLLINPKARYSVV